MTECERPTADCDNVDVRVFIGAQRGAEFKLCARCHRVVSQAIKFKDGSGKGRARRTRQNVARDNFNRAMTGRS